MISIGHTSYNCDAKCGRGGGHTGSTGDAVDGLRKQGWLIICQPNQLPLSFCPECKETPQAKAALAAFKG